MLKVTAHMESPIAGDVPYLDAILEYEMSQRLGLAYKIRRDQRAPPAGEVHIPMLRREFGGVPHIPCCSAPICGEFHETVDRFAKRLAVEHAGLLAEKERLVVAMGNSTYKSYRLPLRVRVAPRIVWFCEGHRRPILQLLRSVKSLGKKRSIGYGRVERWEAEMVDGDYWWFAPHERGTVLMRVLPFCDELPQDLIGYKRDFGAVVPPMWHPDRYTETVSPC
jgi:hypothetical protein